MVFVRLNAPGQLAHAFAADGSVTTPSYSCETYLDDQVRLGKMREISQAEAEAMTK